MAAVRREHIPANIEQSAVSRPEKFRRENQVLRPELYVLQDRLLLFFASCFSVHFDNRFRVFSRMQTLRGHCSENHVSCSFPRQAPEPLQGFEEQRRRGMPTQWRVSP
jgi:hypothetical protein